MKTWTTEAVISPERVLKLELPCDLPPGPVEVVVVVQPHPASPAFAGPNWDEVYGLGKEVWQGVDPKVYVQELRQDPEFLQ